MYTGILALLLLPGVAPLCAAAQPSRDVVVNRTQIDAVTIQALELSYGVRVLDGRYWYDRYSGAWGFEGGPAVGLIHPGLKLGGALRSDASNGRTRVFVNGRELHAQDVWALQQIVGVVLPGRYWLDAYGNVGHEGGPAFMNLAVMARQSGAGGNHAFYRSGNTGYGAGSSGGTSYVMGKDWSVTVDH